VLNPLSGLLMLGGEGGKGTCTLCRRVYLSSEKDGAGKLSERRRNQSNAVNGSVRNEVNDHEVFRSQLMSSVSSSPFTYTVSGGSNISPHVISQRLKNSRAPRCT